MVRILDIFGAYFGRICLSLNDVQYAYVAATFAWLCEHHAVLGLQQSPHDIKNCSLTHQLGLFDILASEGRVRCHEKMTTRSRYQGGYNSNKIIVHVARITERSSARGHNG